MTELSFLESLETIIGQRLADAPDGSYTARLAQQGISKVAQKLGEEGVELALAAVTEADSRVRDESADLLYHLLLLLRLRSIPLSDVVAELEARHRRRTTTAG